jgi:4-amino-4-deoxy-L-arabinose transferase-like glycosyltransferase
MEEVAPRGWQALLPRTWTQWALVAVFVIGFALRLGFAISRGLNAEPKSDEYEYDTYAWNVAQGRGYRGMSPDVADQDHLTAYRPPAPSLLMAGVYAAFGHRYDAVRVVHCLLGASGILLVYGTGLRCFNRVIGLMAASAYAVYPTAIYYTTEMGSEALGIPLFLAAVLVCLVFAERPTWWRAGLAGVLLGLSLLARANFVLMLPFVGIWACWQFRHQWRVVAMGLAVPVLALATLTPWAVRNYLVFGKFIPFSTMGGSVLLQSNNNRMLTDPAYYGYPVWDTKISEEYREALQSANDEVERDRRAKELAVQWLKDHPEHWWFLARSKTERAWTPLLHEESPMRFRVVMFLSWGPVLVLFALAFFPTLVTFLRRGNAGWLIHLAILQYALSVLITSGFSRYRSPIEPYCLILAAAALVFAWKGVRALIKRPVANFPSALSMARTD